MNMELEIFDDNSIIEIISYFFDFHFGFDRLLSLSELLLNPIK